MPHPEVPEPGPDEPKLEPGIKTTRMLSRAVLGGWEIPLAFINAGIRHCTEVLDRDRVPDPEDTNPLPRPGHREREAAVRALQGFMRLKLDERRLELKNPDGADAVTPDTIARAAEIARARRARLAPADEQQHRPD